MTEIHKTAIIDKTAEIDDSVSIGAYSCIGANVVIAAETCVMQHVVIADNTQLGRSNKIFQFSSIGAAPQDKKYHGEGARLIIGDNNIIRECCTINAGANALTKIGEHNWFMAYVHIGHDCQIGNHTVFVNSATLAGHVEVGDYAHVGAFTKAHQFCRIGMHSFSREVTLTRDLLPYVLAVGTEGKDVRLYGINKVGLRRSGLSSDLITILNQCYKRMAKAPVNKEYMPELEDQAKQHPEVKVLVDFIKSSKRGFYYPDTIA